MSTKNDQISKPTTGAAKDGGPSDSSQQRSLTPEESPRHHAAPDGDHDGTTGRPPASSTPMPPTMPPPPMVNLLLAAAAGRCGPDILPDLIHAYEAILPERPAGASDTEAAAGHGPGSGAGLAHPHCILGIVEALCTDLPSHEGAGGGGSTAAAALEWLGLAANGPSKTLGPNLRALAETREQIAAALHASYIPLEAAGWAWKDGTGTERYPSVVRWTMAVEVVAHRQGRLLGDAEWFLRRLHERLPTWCSLIMAVVGESPEPEWQAVKRECRLIEDALFGWERELRPIRYGSISPRLRKLVSIIDVFPGICVTSARTQRDHGDTQHHDRSAIHLVTARVLPDGASTMEQLQDWAWEHAREHVFLRAAMADNGRTDLLLTGRGTLEKAAKSLARLRRTDGATVPDPEAVARRETSWLAYRDRGWLTMDEVKEASGIRTDDREVEQAVVSELRLNWVSATGLGRLYDPKTVDTAVGEGRRGQLLAVLRQRFPGRFQESEPVPVWSGSGHCGDA